MTRRPRLLAPPSEPSVAGMMLVSGVTALALARPGPTEALAALGLLALHMLSFDPAFNAARAGNHRVLAALTLLNTAPYLALLLLGRAAAPALAVAAAMLGLQLYLHARLGPRHPLVYIYGAAVPVLPALALPAALGLLSEKILMYWLLLTAYAVATAAYVETRLPWRRLNPAAPLALWLPAVAAAAAQEPTVLVAAAEPTATMGLNAVRNKKIAPAEIRRFGWVTLARLLAYNTLLALALALA